MDNNSLVELVKTSSFYLKFKQPSQRILSAMRNVDRREFIPEDAVTEITAVQKRAGTTKLIDIASRALVYNDIVVDIGYGQTCSQPSVIALMDDILRLRRDMKVLEIGSGCGYHAAITSHLIGEEGKLITIEYIPGLAGLADINLRKHFRDAKKRTKVIHGDGSIGFSEEAPFDRIYLTCGIINSFNPQILIDQLNPNGGILLYPEICGDLVRLSYDKGEITEQRFGKVFFVPLKGENS
jgi:protein-L-isoaspartate(D-aspartate) O-methyltransferase